MTTSQDMMNEFKRLQELKEYRERQKQEQQSRYNPMNAMSKINSLRNNINKVGSGLSSLGMKAFQSNMPKMASFGVGAQNLGNKLQSFGNTSNAASNVSNVANTANTVGNAGQAAGTLSNAAGALGKAGGAVGAVAGGASAANNFAKGDYVNGGLDTAKTVASFMGPWGMAAAAAINMYQKMQSKQKAKQMKEMQKSQEQMSKTEQANEESLAGLQDAFQNDSEQAAQNMTLPTNNQTLSQDIMSQINPDYTASASGSPTGFAANVNTPDDTQTLQNNQSVVPQVEDVNGNISAFPTTREAFAKSLTDNGWTEDVVNSALQGLNGGNKDMADYISAYNNNAPDDQKIGIPKTDEEIELARNGQFYQPQGNTQDNNEQLKESLLERIKNGLGDFKAGYEDNSINGFAQGDLANKLANSSQPTTPQNGVLTGGAAQTKKTLMNRIGEAAGTGRRLMANPWTQAAIAGLVSKAAGGDIDDMAIAAYQYGTNKAKADDYYRKMNPNAKVMPVFNNYTADDYKAKAYNDYNQMRTEINAPTADEYYKQQFLQNYLTADEYNRIINDPNYDPSARVNLNQVKQAQKNANDVRKTDIQADKNNWQKSQGQQKVNIQAQNANEKKRHNGVTEKQNGQKIDALNNKQNVKNAEEELKARGFKKVNGQWVKQ